MIDFEFVSPTKIYFGENKENLIGDILVEYKAKKVLIIIGQGSAIKSGLLDRVVSKINQTNIKHYLLKDIRPNPTIEKCEEGVKLVKDNDIDFILAIGGGSVIDTAKLISVAVFHKGNIFDFNLHKAIPHKALPIGVILTISAAGSELSNSCVIQDEITEMKIGFNSDLVRPVFAIENPKLTFSVNKIQTAYGIVDILMHTLERYLSYSEDNDLCDSFAEGLLQATIKAGKVVMDNLNDYQARATLMLASSLSHNGITNIGKKFQMPVHQLEHAISGKYPFVAHAAGLAVLFPNWAKYYVRYDVDKFDLLARNVFSLSYEDKYQNAVAGINEIEKLFTGLNMPKTFKDLGIDNPDIISLANHVSNNGSRIIYHHKKIMDRDVIIEIYKMCL